MGVSHSPRFFIVCVLEVILEVILIEDGHLICCICSDSFSYLDLDVILYLGSFLKIHICSKKPGNPGSPCCCLCCCCFRSCRYLWSMYVSLNSVLCHQFCTSIWVRKLANSIKIKKFVKFLKLVILVVTIANYLSGRWIQSFPIYNCLSSIFEVNLYSYFCFLFQHCLTIDSFTEILNLAFLKGIYHEDRFSLVEFFDDSDIYCANLICEIDIEHCGYNNWIWSCNSDKANMQMLEKCYDIKMVKLPGCSSVGASLCGWPTPKKKKNTRHQSVVLYLKQWVSNRSNAVLQENLIKCFLFQTTGEL